MTPDAFGRAIAVYPALLTAYSGAPVTLSPADAIALLELFDAVDALASAEHQVADLTDRVSATYPALERWRQLVLDAGAQRPPLERAAAWEAHAVELDRHGNAWLAHRARLAAAQCLASSSPHASSHAA
ncbi:MAG TPA: hypothetical protein VN607_01930 [Gemmatimonadaceae bacterium]|nr:hypothetical protein [Gemmatimonadaceae bacterium]